MKKQILSSLLLLTVILAVGCKPSKDVPGPQAPADKLLLLGNVITMDTATPTAEAVFVERCS